MTSYTDADFQAAIEAAWGAWPDSTRPLAGVVSAVLDVVAPAIAARAKSEALREAANALAWKQPEVSPCGSNVEACCGSVESCDAMQPGVKVIDSRWLRARADEIERAAT